MIKKVFFLMFFILINFSSAFQLNVSPPSMEISLKSGEVVCKEITLSASSNLDVSVNDIWAREGEMSKDLKKYNLISSEIGIYTSYNNLIQLNEKKVFSFCIYGTKPGIYRGALMFSSGNIGVGTWILVNATSIKDSTNHRLTGFIVFDNFDKTGLNFIVIILLIVLILLIIFYLRIRSKIASNKNVN